MLDSSGVLVSGKGTRFILANTEQLHTKIHDMSDRIRHLEEALESLQSQCSPEPHPLLRPEFLGIKSTMGLYGGTQVGAEASATPSENGHDRDVKHAHMDVDVLDRNSSEETQKGLIVQVSLSRYFGRYDFTYLRCLEFIRAWGRRCVIRRGRAIKPQLPITGERFS
jgi:hypothetical protein